MKLSSDKIGACFFFNFSISRNFFFLIAAFVVTACSNSSNSNAIFVKEDLIIPLNSNEEKLPKDKERVEHYFALLGESPFQIPLLQPIQGDKYKLFAALPVGSTMKQIEQSWSEKNQPVQHLEKHPWKFSWRNRDTLNFKVTDLVAQREEDVIYFLIATQSESDHVYSADSLIVRLHSLDHTP
ncbi:MAG: hypothetical protein LC670_01625 [Flavobacteriales bacterium]|nr:hypothetical protein [Flavobacteriales bacterium]